MGDTPTGNTGHIQGEPVLVPTSDGRELYAQVLPGPGTGPTVVFEAGAAASRSTWALVQPAVGEWARAIVYDRSGLGRSAPDPRSRSLHRMADDLGQLLDHFGPGPYVLVGHSAGGPIVRLAAAAQPDRIAGLVLVDPTDEAADVLFGPGFRRLERVAIRVNMVLAHTGLLGVAYRGMAKALPVDAARDIQREGFTVGIVRTHAAQARTFLDELAAFRDSPPELGDVPVTVISGGLAGAGMNARFRAAANASHAVRVAVSPRGRHVIAAKSGHYVPVSEPAVIIAAIRELVVPPVDKNDHEG
nr:alpha/beta hydrolase [Kibdelosporangium sp. MJ126-NF4]CEL19980.1 alpha/beta hydrolase fold [Kibdelosporangium sp. MJ126-NF4]CTQ97204.1 alpha/beta hydrolase fold [Kibdelosporangium sp. MJ126-NF4]